MTAFDRGMYVLNKIVGWCVSPVGLALVGFALALLLRAVRRGRLARGAFALSLAWLWIWSTPLMGRIVGATLEAEFLSDGKVPTVESFPNADVILVLGGGMGSETNILPYAEMWTSADRVWQAARLYKAGKASRICATGWGVQASTWQLLVDFGVPESAIVLLDEPRNTEEEARICQATLGREASGAGHRPRVLLVTSAWHMKRAKMMFDRYAPDLETVPAPADWENSIAATKGWSPLDLLPNPMSLMWNGVTFHEWLGIFCYRFFR